ncbi:rod shape-determining protein RodA [bacterium]|nr:rod shape-determining protein RodA [bacterium]
MEDIEEGQRSRFDWPLLLVILLLVGMGLVNIYSATHGHGDGDFLTKQLIALTVALVASLGVILLDYRIFDRVAYVLYGVNLFALALVPFLGVTRNGARRWIDLGAFNWQPSETMKIITILALAKFFQKRNQVKKMGLKDLVIPGLIAGVPALMTISQPDLGTGGHILIVGVAILLFVGIRPKILIGACILGIVSFPIFWQYGLKAYQKDRIVTFINPMRDPRGEGYNAIQSLIAVGSGELTGKGYQKGTQTQLEFTPEGHTDFIFTVLAEEWGLIGAIVLFLLYVLMFYRMVGISSMASDTFGALLGVGITALLASQIFINIAMVCGMFPIVGIPLPLLSYGGTSLLTSMLGLALLMNVGFRRSIF